MKKTTAKPRTPAVRRQAKTGEVSPDWRTAMLSRVRALIEGALPGVTEERKWRAVPVWSLDGPICTGETYTKAVKLTFFKGASLPDPARLFNASRDGNARRAIDLHEGDSIDEAAFVALLRSAVSLNRDAPRRGRRP